MRRLLVGNAAVQNQAEKEGADDAQNAAHGGANEPPEADLPDPRLGKNHQPADDQAHYQSGWPGQLKRPQ